MRDRRNSLRNLCWIAVLLIAVGCIVYGCAREEWELVLQKAVNICFQCIGLG